MRMICTFNNGIKDPIHSNKAGTLYIKKDRINGWEANKLVSICKTYRTGKNSELMCKEVRFLREFVNNSYWKYAHFLNIRDFFNYVKIWWSPLSMSRNSWWKSYPINHKKFSFLEQLYHFNRFTATKTMFKKK